MTTFVTVSLSWVDWAFPTKDKKLITITRKKTFIVIYFKSQLNKVNVPQLEKCYSALSFQNCRRLLKSVQNKARAISASAD